MTTKILFVCTGNICRSPMAEGVFAAQAEAAGLDVQVDSAGTHGYHVGEPPDPRAVRVAGMNGVDISAQRARKVARQDFQNYDVVVALDHGHLELLQSMDKGSGAADIRLLMSFAGGGDVPDPYYDSEDAFIRAYRLIEAGAAGLVEHIRRKTTE